MAPRNSDDDDSQEGRRGEKRLDSFERKMDALIQTVQQIQVDIAIIKVRPICSNPNMCMTLKEEIDQSHEEIATVLDSFKEEVKQIDTDVKDLKNTKSYAEGVMKPIVLAGAFFFSIVGGVATVLVTNLLSKPEPAQIQQPAPRSTVPQQSP